MGKISTSVQNPTAANSNRQQQAEHSNSKQNTAAAGKTQRKRAKPNTTK